MRRILALTLVAVLVGPAAFAEGDWQHDLGIYAWLAGLEGAIGISEVGEQPVEASFDDLLNYLDFAMAGHYEARGPKTVYLLDVSYTGLASEREAQVVNQPVNVKMDLDQWIVEVGGGIRVDPKIDVLLAGRYYIIDTGATFTAIEENSGSVGVEWFDIFLGGRYHSPIGTKWFWSIRADLGFGGSDFAWFGQASIGYHISDHFSGVAAWRLLGLDYTGDESSHNFIYNVTQSGLGLALAYSF